MSEDPTCLFNRKGFLERLEGDMGLMRAILNVYIEEIPTRKQAFLDAAKRNDAAALGKLAHSLKGASATIKAESVRELAFQLEMACKAQELESCLNLCEPLLGELERLGRHLGEVLEQS